jgi:hypothetical protein
LCNNDVLYICITSNKFDLKQAIRVLHTYYGLDLLIAVKVCSIGVLD